MTNEMSNIDRLVLRFANSDERNFATLVVVVGYATLNLVCG